MHKKLTITIDEKVYAGLYKKIGAGKISRFVEELVRPHVIIQDIEPEYELMARDIDREEEALEWAESTLGDSVHETR